jgi:hypothetical protein
MPGSCPRTTDAVPDAVVGRPLYSTPKRWRSLQHFIEKWWLWVAVRRWPDLAARLRECGRRSAEAADLMEARAASAEIGEILRVAADAAA